MQGTLGDQTQPILAAGCLSLNRYTMRVSCESRELRMSLRTFRMLEYFMQRAGRIVTRDELWSVIWGRAKVDLRSIDQEIQRLRRAMTPKRRACMICTVRNQGYVLETAGKITAAPAPDSRAC